MSDSPAVILVNPQLGENIGTAARAMANFGISDLRIVQPRDGWPSKRARAASAKGVKIVDEAKVFADLPSAISDLNHLYATTARPRDMIKTVFSPEQAASDMHVRQNSGQKVGILFGRERWGLSNDEIALADEIIMAPVDPKCASINIAQAVLLVCYEWFKPKAASLGQETGELPAAVETGLRMPGTEPASKQQLLGMYEHLESELDDAGFFKSKEIRPKMVVNLRNLFARAEMTEQEVRTFRGVIASLTRQHLRRKYGK